MGSWNVLSPEICVPKETKDTNVKSYNMITDKDEAKGMTEHISCDCKCKFNSATCNSKQKWNNKVFISVNKVIVGTLVHLFVRIVGI